MASVIEIVKISKFYDRKTLAVSDLSLKVENKEIFGFLGPNGAGKTTTIRCMLGLLHLSGGEINILGENTDGISSATRKRIGYLPGDSYFYGHMTGQEYLDYFLTLYNSSDNYQQELIALFQGVKLSRPIKMLSKGQMRMIGIITAFQHDPEVLILDEPTSGLDPLKQQAFYSLVKQERERGKTFFISSHNLREVQQICDRVGIIRQGKLVKTESVTNLLNIRLKNVKISTNEKNMELLLHILTEAKGIKDLKCSEMNLEFAYSGQYSDLIEALGAVDEIIDLTVENPSLEEVFLRYYIEEENHREVKA